MRYADDFVITGDSKEILESVVRPWVEAFLAVRGLQLSEAKTRITHIDEGFDFLGWNFRKYSGKLLIKPSKKNAQAFYRKVAETISGNKTVKQGDLIQLLNPMLRGWAQYHRPVSAKQTYSRMEHLIFRKLWRWSKRRHPQKSAVWVKQKYFHSIGARHWVFAVRTVREDGSWGLNELYQLSGMAIKRHTRIKGEFNPFDPTWEQYGETLAAGAHVGTNALPKAVGDAVYVTRRAMRALWLCLNGRIGLARPSSGISDAWRYRRFIQPGAASPALPSASARW